MAKWDSSVKHETYEINSGNRYEKKDRLSREQLNAITENSFYAVNKSEEALEKSESAFTGNGTIARVAGTPQPFLDFKSDPQRQIDQSAWTVFYKKGDAELGWNNTAVVNGDFVFDLNPYKRVRVTVDINWTGGVFEVDLENICYSQYYYGGIIPNISTDDTSLIKYAGITVPQDKLSFYVQTGYFLLNENRFVHREYGGILQMEGILK